MGKTLPFLRNSYWILRHGKSIPNENGLIVSSMENGTLEEFGLAPDGIEQAKLAGELFDKVTFLEKIGQLTRDGYFSYGHAKSKEFYASHKYGIQLFKCYMNVSIFIFILGNN